MARKKGLRRWNRLMPADEVKTPPAEGCMRVSNLTPKEIHPTDQKRKTKKKHKKKRCSPPFTVTNVLRVVPSDSYVTFFFFSISVGLHFFFFPVEILYNLHPKKTDWLRCNQENEGRKTKFPWPVYNTRRYVTKNRVKNIKNEVTACYGRVAPNF